ncbi:MAG: peptidase Ste24p [Candidatus Eremiobacteraeota bacterium]|jgi:predicted Zn-dependent protease|nr:peptidase Ste24p [Candidatus Eremiobacteraeota bacterium]
MITTMPRTFAHLAAFAVTLAIGLATVCAAPAQADQSDDETMGLGVYDDLKAKGQVVEGSPYLPILRRVGDRLSAAARPHWFTERFYVVRGNQINAFSAPGGYVFVNEGLLRTINNTDELANVLGHETAHLVLGHVQAKVQQQKRKSFLTNIGKALTGKGSTGSQNTFDAATQIGNYSFLNFTRQQEYAADELGAKLAAKAGYNPWGTVWFFNELGRLVGDAGYEQYVQEHPSTSDRTERIARYLRDGTAYARWKNRPPTTTGLVSP